MKDRDLEHPEITRALLTGYPHGEPEYPHCPVCGEVPYTIYKDLNGEIVGCDECITQLEPWEYMEDDYL